MKKEIRFDIYIFRAMLALLVLATLGSDSPVLKKIRTRLAAQLNQLNAIRHKLGPDRRAQLSTAANNLYVPRRE